MNCKRCNAKLAALFCLRCKRSICKTCYDDSLGLCIDCINFKKTKEWDRRQLVRTLAELTTIASEKLMTESCHGCIILRHQLLYTLKTLKDLGIELEIEDLSGLKNPVSQLREAILPLVIESIAQKQLDADPSSWCRI